MQPDISSIGVGAWPGVAHSVTQSRELTSPRRDWISERKKDQAEAARNRGEKRQGGRHPPVATHPSTTHLSIQHGTRPRRAAAEQRRRAPAPATGTGSARPMRRRTPVASCRSIAPPFLSFPHPSAARRESATLRQTPQNHRTAPPAHAAAAVGDALPSRSFHRGGAAHARGPPPHRTASSSFYDRFPTSASVPHLHHHHQTLAAAAAADRPCLPRPPTRPGTTSSHLPTCPLWRRPSPRRRLRPRQPPPRGEA